MTEHIKDTKALHKEVPSIFAGLPIAKPASRQRQAKLLGSTETAHFAGRSPIAAQMISLQFGPQLYDKPKQKTARPKQSKRTAAKVFKRFFYYVPFSRSRRERKRLRSARKHLLINMQERSNP